MTQSTRSGRVRKIYSGEKLPDTVHTQSFRTRGGCGNLTYALGETFFVLLLISPHLLQAQMWGPVIQLNLVRSVNFIVAFITDQSLCNAALLDPNIRRLCYRLAPLRRVEEDLVKILSRRAASLAMTQQKLHNPLALRLLENVVQVGNAALRIRRSEESTTRPRESDYGPSRRVLDALGDDIAALWQDVSLQKALKSAEIALEEEPGL
jgi:hypothetical protein